MTLIVICKSLTFINLVPVVDSLVLSLVVVETVDVNLLGIVSGQNLSYYEPVGQGRFWGS